MSRKRGVRQLSEQKFPAAVWLVDAGKKTHLLRHFILKIIILPRQARDKHGESTQKERRVFLQRRLSRRRLPVRGPATARGSTKPGSKAGWPSRCLRLYLANTSSRWAATAATMMVMMTTTRSLRRWRRGSSGTRAPERSGPLSCNRRHCSCFHADQLPPTPRDRHRGRDRGTGTGRVSDGR